MLEKVSAALNTTPTTIPQTPHISKNQKKKKLVLLQVAYGLQYLRQHHLLFRVSDEGMTAQRLSQN